MLVRSYVGERLAEYYRQPGHKVVGRVQSDLLDDGDPRLLGSLLGEWHWRRVFRRLYEEREGQWLTPVELFRPHYSRILGDFCISALSSQSNHLPPPVEIVELGGGRGTNAALILSYLQEVRPDLYDRLTYTLVDSSPTLHEAQKRALRDGPHAGRVRFQLTDLTDVAEGR